MNRNLLSLLVSLAYPLALGVVPEGGGSETEGKSKKKGEPSVTIPEKVESWLALGKKEGNRVRLALEKGEMLQRDILLTYGKYLASEEASSNDFLTGYASAWPNPNTAKVRKAEAKAVFDAYAIGEESRDLVVGYNKETQSPIKETRTVAEWLEDHQNVSGHEGYAGLIRMAKGFRGKAQGQGAGGGVVRGPRLTEKQVSEFMERLPAASSATAMQLAEKATAQLASLPGTQPLKAWFREIVMITETIKKKTDDKRILSVTGQIFDLCHDILTAMQAEENAKGTPQAPKPAEAPAAQGETVPAQKTGTAG